MKPLEEIYGKRFFARRHRLSWRAKPVVDAIMEVLNPSSLIDVGCGIGDYVAEFKRRGIIAYGIEGSKEVYEFIEPDAIYCIFTVDLRKPFEITLPKYELCMSFEVLEHIEPEYVDQLIDNLCQLSDKILVSAATPGQGGHYHVNCQLSSYWIRKFYDRKYYYKYNIVEKIRECWEPWRQKKEMSSYYNNLLYFEKSIS